MRPDSEFLTPLPLLYLAAAGALAVTLYVAHHFARVCNAAPEPWVGR
ncbi:MAG: hypothetical protein V7604_448 [Hyphomicrobiales bacterium]|jgi:hypothetical protein